MKVCLCGDWHITDKKPEKRTDENYLQTVLDKIKWVFETAEENKCSVILQAGDFFNSVKASHYVVSSVIDLCSKHKIALYTIYGQHDLHYHSKDVSNTPLNTLYKAGLVDILEPDDVDFCGVSWEEEIPKKSKAKILVVHKMVSNSRELFEYTSAKALRKEYPQFELILCGDNHKSFLYSESSRGYLVNPGSLMRTTIEQLQHKPVIYIYDTNTKILFHKYVPIKKAKDVFDLTDIDEIQKHNEELQAFVNGLHDDIELQGLDFVQNLKDYLKKNKASTDIQNTINDILRSCSNE